MKSLQATIKHLADSMYSLYMSGSNNYNMFDEIAMAAYIYGVERSYLRQQVKDYIKMHYKRSL